MGEGQQAAGLNLYLDRERRRLVAIYTPGPLGVTLDVATLKKRVEEEGHGKLFFPPNALLDLARRCTANDGPFEMDVAEERDSEVNVWVDSSKMAAYLTITPPFGGRGAGRVEVDRALAAAGVVTGLLEDAIAGALQAGQAEALLVAQGRQPIHGLDGRLEHTLPDIKERRPRITAEGLTDYRDMGDILIVQEGEALMRRILPTEGEHGETVLGQVIPALPGKGALFASNLPGTVFDPVDPDVLKAAMPGQPVKVKDGVIIDPVYAAERVDISTGNIVFDGAVKISGDVQAGMTIRATGDIYVGGTVEAANLQSGGDIVIKGGVIGRADARDMNDENAISHVHCKGSLTARFIQNAKVLAEDSVFVDEAIMQSEIEAGHAINVGKNGAQKGHIVGGVIRAGLLVKVQTLGAPSHIRTQVGVGLDPQLQDRLRLLAQQRDELGKKREDVDRLLAFVAKNPGKVSADNLEKANKTAAFIDAKLAELAEELDGLSHRMTLAERPQLIIEKRLHGGVHIQFGNRYFESAEDREAGVFALRDGELAYDILFRQRAAARGGA